MLTAIAWRTGEPNPYLADQHGMIYHLVNGRSDPVLDLTAEVMDYQAGAEYRMLGMTFDPVDGRIILGFNGNDVDTRIVSYAVGDDGPHDPASAHEILRIDKPGVRHNRGQLAFDRATGDMWIGNVGESSWEAVYKIPAGQKGYNLGWPPTKARTRRTSTTTCRHRPTP
jgi:hypothetical protein